jgi:hypothetical protein
MRCYSSSSLAVYIQLPSMALVPFNQRTSESFLRSPTGLDIKRESLLTHSRNPQLTAHKPPPPQSEWITTTSKVVTPRPPATLVVASAFTTTLLSPFGTNKGRHSNSERSRPTLLLP